MIEVARRSILHVLLAVFCLLTIAPLAHAACTNPAGDAADMIYNTATQQFQYCNGTSWIAAHPPGSGSGGCADPSGAEGAIIYNPSHRVLQGCAGNVWRAMGPIGGLPGEGFAQIVAGGDHTCGIKPDGTLWCWGGGFFGQMGDGTRTSKNKPVQIVESGPWASLAAGGATNCAIKTDGTAWCWGKGGDGAMGNGNTPQVPPNYTTPVQVADAGPWDMVTPGIGSGGGSHSCGIMADGTAWCWGQGDNGELGYSSTSNAFAPVQVSETGPWETISAGANFTCGIKTDGTAWCWGQDSYGKLGNGSTTGDQLDPVQVSVPGPWETIDAGLEHTCGIKSDGTAWCWGRGGQGQLGDGTATDQDAPVQVSDAGPWAMISAGEQFTCGIKTDDTAWCWGTNGLGQLGDGGTSQQNNPVQIAETGPWASITASLGGAHACGRKTDGSTLCWGSDSSGQLGRGYSHVPVRVTDAGPWDTIDAGHQHTCAIKTDGSAWCWGSDGGGQLGNGAAETVDQYDPVPITEAGPWDVITAGNSASCGVKDDSTAWCWGSDSNGKLGCGGCGAQSDPVQISEPGPWASVSTSVTGDFTCGLKVDGTAWCWGGDGSEQLGDGAGATNQPDPVQISEAGPWDAISAGRRHACGVKTDGTAWCWGQGGFGQRGDGTQTDSDVPVQITEAGPWATISAGGNGGNTCAIKTDGTAWCWGAGEGGMLGNGSTTQRQDTPVQVSEAGPWASVSVGLDHVCAVKTDETAWCWGSGNNGVLGNGSVDNQLVPAQIAEPGPWAAASAGQLHSCWIKTDGTAWCWGSLANGKLGIGNATFATVATGVGGSCGIGEYATSEGQFSYNVDHNVMQYCAGAGFVQVGK